MKYKIALLALTLPLISAGQKIEGVGFLRIGRTTVAFVDSMKGEGYKYRQTSSSSFIQPNSWEYWILQEVQPESGLDVLSPLLPEHKKFHINQIWISDIKIENVDLEFYKDTLFSIKIENPSSGFSEALEIKYGKPKLEVKNNTITCTSRIAGSYKLEEVSFTANYRKDKITAFSYHKTYYNDKCEKSYLNFFLIEKNDTVAAVSKKESEARAEFDKKVATEKKNTLTDFR